MPAEYDNDGALSLPPHATEVRSLLVKCARAYKGFLSAVGSHPRIGSTDRRLLDDAETLGAVSDDAVMAEGIDDYERQASEALRDLIERFGDTQAKIKRDKPALLTGALHAIFNTIDAGVRECLGGTAYIPKQPGATRRPLLCLD